MSGLSAAKAKFVTLEVKSKDTIYYAETDGIVSIKNGTYAIHTRLYADPGNVNPTGLKLAQGNSDSYASFSYPIPKGWSWKVTADNTPDFIGWTPLK